ncbi:hypothetical protein ElyMa_005479100 [Elysia marginata]|uniref:Secreted protein n=1 Tax=Elysia marginata TaxID=1093978 RepID=A0AAV4EQI8_9GAST|nr:hypothetical protein ElyMa_005479100 [Elysia marginata]
MLSPGVGTDVRVAYWTRLAVQRLIIIALSLATTLAQYRTAIEQNSCPATNSPCTEWVPHCDRTAPGRPPCIYVIRCARLHVIAYTKMDRSMYHVTYVRLYKRRGQEKAANHTVTKDETKLK